MSIINFQQTDNSLFLKLLIDAFVKSQKPLAFVIPAQAGHAVKRSAIQRIQEVLDSRFRGSDGFEDFLRFRLIMNTHETASFYS